MMTDEINNPLIFSGVGREENTVIPDPGMLRWQFIKDYLRKEEGRFTYRRELSFLVGSWNVNGQEICGTLHDWLHAETAPDLVFIGLQEMDRRAETLLIASGSKESEWNGYILQNLYEIFPGEKYKYIVSRSLVGIYAGMFVREGAGVKVDEATTSIAGCGIMGVMGNKGGVAIRVRIEDDYICFVSSHLAPHVGNVARRNQNFAELSKRLMFPKIAKERKGSAVEDLIRSWNDVEFGPATLNDCSLLIWCGDLNYRIDLPPVETRNLALSGQYEALLLNDQLIQAMVNGDAFAEFKEGPITFAPTYKYVIGSDSFDPLPEGRAPAWPDRILIRGTAPKTQILYYRSGASLKQSDHKPVSSFISSYLRTVDPQKFEAVFGDTLRQIDTFENDSLPLTQVSRNILDYGVIPYMRSMMMTFELLNIGHVVAKFSFIPPPGRNELAHPWIHVQPKHGLILPGSAAEIRVYISIDGHFVHGMNQGVLNPADILILHVEGGRDHFVKE